MTLQKKDFVEIEFTGRVKGGEVFDSTIKEDLEKMHQGHDHPIEAKPFIFCLGEGMFLKSIDDFLIGKEPGKSYEVELLPENAFGKRNPAFVMMIPLKIFKEKNVAPIVGANFNFDGKIGKILTVSGGRVMVDFNHFLAGKTLDYKINVLRKIESTHEKIDSLNNFFFRKNFKYTVKDDKIVMEIEKPLVKVVELFKNNFKEMLNLDLEIKEIEEIKEIAETKVEETSENKQNEKTV